jgi:hypothetical protein
MGLNVLGTRLVILNSPEHITQLLEKRSAITSLRPYFEMAHGL